MEAKNKTLQEDQIFIRRHLALTDNSFTKSNALSALESCQSTTTADRDKTQEVYKVVLSRQCRLRFGCIVFNRLGIE